jgi:small-conductance mechanosensitive channel
MDEKTNAAHTSLVAGAALLAVAIFLGLAVHALVEKLAHRFIRDPDTIWHAFLDRTHDITRALFVLIALNLAIQLPYLPARITDPMSQFLSAAVILAIGWAALIAVDMAADVYLRRFNVTAADNLLARKGVTQVRVLKRAAQVLIAIIAVAAALMTFGPVRQFGVSLFASAGVAGLVVGLAARPLLANLIAGVQLAMTQPIRIDDAVVVENEWGWIEEITSTYVVIKLWDWRRLIVPLSYFMEKPFQNWTRESASIIGSVMVYVDYTAPVEIIRRKLTEVAKQSRLWDGRVVNLQVSDAKTDTLELRALVSARTSPEAWDLRCEVREKLITFLQTEYPQALPRHRLEMPNEAPAPPQHEPAKDQSARSGDTRELGGGSPNRAGG